MPIQTLIPLLTPAQVTAITDGLTAAKSNFPNAVNLTEEENGSMVNIGDQRFTMVNRVVVNLAPANPNLVNGYNGTLAQATEAFKFFNQVEVFLPLLNSLVEIYTETQRVDGHFAYKFALGFYEAAQAAAKAGVPGSQAIVDELSPFFEKSAPVIAPPNNP